MGVEMRKHGNWLADPTLEFHNTAVGDIEVHGSRIDEMTPLVPKSDDISRLKTQGHSQNGPLCFCSRSLMPSADQLWHSLARLWLQQSQNHCWQVWYFTYSAKPFLLMNSFDCFRGPGSASSSRHWAMTLYCQQQYHCENCATLPGYLRARQASLVSWMEGSDI